MLGSYYFQPWLTALWWLFLFLSNQGYNGQNMEILNQRQILQERSEVEQELLDFLKETGSDFSLDHIKEIIYNEEGQDDLTDIIAMFDTGQGAIELENIIETINDAWNYFPHKILNGLLPAEKLLEHHNITKKSL